MDRDLHRAHADLDDSHWWFVGRRRIIDATLRRHVTEAASAADVGTGSGGLLPVLRRFGELHAIEGDEEAVRNVRQRYPEVDVHCGDLPEAVDTLPKVDLITAFDVIEHVDDDVDLLRRMAGRLPADGSLCITVPALPLLWSAHDEANGHRRRYTKRLLTRAVADAGFEVVHVSYFNTLLFPVVLVARLLERLRGPASAGDLDRSAGLADALLERLFSAERFLVPRVSLPVGVSLILVARRAP